MAPRAADAAGRALVAGLAVLVLVLAAGARGAGQPPPGYGSVGRWIVDPQGRVFVPHGLNLVVTRPPFWSSWFSEQDARFIASQGFTAMRINVIPEALEPGLGHVDATYLGHFAGRQAQLARHGIATLLTLNQDDYSSRCGGNGFPSWAVLAPCAEPWAPFWADDAAADGVGLQAHFLSWWSRLAARFAGARGLLGYDLLNEPEVLDDATLGDLLRRSVATVREADARHLAFAEPRDPGAPAFGGPLPAGSGLAAHVYCQPTLQLGLAGKTPTRAEIDACIRSDRTMLRSQVDFARQQKLPLVVGEFGATDEVREQAALVDAMGEAFVPWFAYAYTGRLDSSGAPAQSLLRDDRRPGSEANAKQGKLDALVVPYPLATAGTPRAWRFDREKRTVFFSYSTARAGGGSFARGLPTVVLVPRRVYPRGYVASASGAAVVSAPGAARLRLVAKPGARIVRVRLAPRVLR